MEINWFKNRRESGMSNSTVDSGYGGSVGSTNGFGNHDNSQQIVQMAGIMQKKPFGHQSTKWSKRFFVLKEGFLLYYAESEKKIFETKKVFNIHPKGVIPLGNCIIEDLSLPGMPYCINVCHPDLKTSICVAADDEDCRKMWIRAMDKASKVTIENSGLSENMIKSLQEQSLQLARERQEYVDKFISEAEELGAERELREALEEFNQELEEENARIEALFADLQNQHDEVKSELNQAIESSKTLEKDREEMRAKTDELQKNLEVLSNERAAIIDKLQDREARVGNSAEENAELARQLAAIEERAKLLETDKEAIRIKLEENQEKAKDLMRDREAISLEAEGLKAEMQSLSDEKRLAEEELKSEVVARMELQKELEECKAALRRLEEKALNNNSESQVDGKGTENGQTDGEEQIMKDVKSLREFFENCARENMMDEKAVPAKQQSRPNSTSSEPDKVGKPKSPVRVYKRATMIRRRPHAQTLRCKSMVMDDFSISTLVREPSHRRSILLSRHKRSMSLSGQKKTSAARKTET